jgi:hypothetical protein
MVTKKIFFHLGSFIIKDGSEIRFWKDRWLDNYSSWTYHALYYIVRHKNDTVAKVLETSLPNITFRWDLSGQRFVFWNALLQRLADVQLQTSHDKLRWNLHENSKFLVDSMYNALI